MEYSTLYELIRFLQYGNHLHIGVIFLEGRSGNAFSLPTSQTIHDSAVCWKAKGPGGNNRRCYRCRQAAIKKAVRTHQNFGGYCINGVYEYTRPVMREGKCAAVIYIGNILGPEDRRGRLARVLGDDMSLLETMERDFDLEECRSLGKLIESYIRALWEMLPPGIDGKSGSVVENIKQYIDANLDCEIKLQDVAPLFHYNPQYLGRLFKQETGMCFSEYVNRERILQAAMLLNSETPIIHVAYQVGFNNVTYFNRVFRRHFGLSPSAYRLKSSR